MNVFPSQVEELLLKVPGLAPHYQLILDRDGHMDRLSVVVERRVGQEASAGSAMAKELQRHIKSYIGVNTAIDVVAPGEVERSQGKAKRVIDNRSGVA